MGDYVHVDVSSDFTTIGKALTTIWFILIWGLILKRPTKKCLPLSCFSSRTVIAFIGSIIMILLRKMLYYIDHGPTFNINRSVLIEPLIFLFACMILSESMKINLKHINTDNMMYGYMTWTATLSALWQQDNLLESAIMNIQSQSSSSLSVLFYALTWSALLGSGLTLTGSFTNIITVTLAYDDISWKEVLHNMYIPVLVSLVILYITIAIFMKFNSISNTNNGIVTTTETTTDTTGSSLNYSGIPTNESNDLDSKNHGLNNNETYNNTNTFIEEKKCDDDEEVGTRSSALSSPTTAAIEMMNFATSSSSSEEEEDDDDDNNSNDPEYGGTNNNNNNKSLKDDFASFDFDDEDDQNLMYEVILYGSTIFSLMMSILFKGIGNHYTSIFFFAIFMILLLPVTYFNGRTYVRIYLLCTMISTLFIFNTEPIFTITLIASFMLLLHEKDDTPDSDLTTTTTNAIESLLKKIDYNLIIFYVSQFIIFGSMNDTGVFSMVYTLLMGNDCVDLRFGETYYCLYRSTTVFGFMSVLFSPIGMLLTAASTFPYASPFEWMIFAWVATVMGNCTIYESTIYDNIKTKYGLSPPISWCKLIIWSIVPSTVFLFIGVTILSTRHVSMDCSIKLGECN